MSKPVRRMTVFDRMYLSIDIYCDIFLRNHLHKVTPADSILSAEAKSNCWESDIHERAQQVIESENPNREEAEAIYREISDAIKQGKCEGDDFKEILKSLYEIML